MPIEWGPVAFKTNVCVEPDSASRAQWSCSMKAAPPHPFPPPVSPQLTLLSVGPLPLPFCVGPSPSLCTPSCTALPALLPAGPRSLRTGGLWEYVVNWMTNPVPTRQREMAAPVNFQMCPELMTSFSSQAMNGLSREARHCSVG